MESVTSVPLTTGVDTLKLFFPLRLWRRPDFHILQRRQVRGRDLGEGYLWRDPQGQLAYGAMAVRRVGAFRFRIAPLGNEIKLRAFFSAPAIAHGDNARTLTADELRLVLEQMQTTLYDLGVEVDWREGQLSRVDVQRDVALPRPFHYYLPALYLIEPPYNRLWQNYPTGVLRGAATRLVYNLYDKRAERARRRRPDFPPDLMMQYAPGWLRCEARLISAAAVRASLRIKTAEELVEQYGQLGIWMDERVKTELLNERLPEHIGHTGFTPPTFTPDDELWWRTQLGVEAGDFIDRLALLGLRLAYQTIGPQRFWELAKDNCYDEKLQPSKLRAHFRQVALASFSDEMLPVAHLYAELRRCLLYLS